MKVVRNATASPFVDDWEEERRRSLFDGAARYKVDETFGTWDGGPGRPEGPRRVKVTLPKIRGL